MITNPPPKISTKNKNYMWHVACDMWHMTCDMWHLTHHRWWTLCQNFRSLALTIWESWCFEDFEEKDDWLNESINDKGVSRAAPATPGLLISYWGYLDEPELLNVAVTPSCHGARLFLLCAKQNILAFWPHFRFILGLFCAFSCATFCNKKSCLHKRINI